MNEWPNEVLPPFQVISTFSAEAVGSLENASVTAMSSLAWPTANLAHFVPLRLNLPILPALMFSLNAGVVNGNIDVGIYLPDGTRLWSAGSTAQAGTNAIQKFIYTGPSLGPGEYYIALALNNNTGQIFRHQFVTSTGIVERTGMRSMASAFPLPATAVFTLPTMAGPIFGLMQGRSIL